MGSDSEQLKQSKRKKKQKLKQINDAIDSDDDNDDGLGLDLDSFIEGVLDGIGGNDDNDSSDTEKEQTATTPNPTRSLSKSNTLNSGTLINSDLENESDSESISLSKRARNNKQNETDFRLIVYSHLDRGEFMISNNGVTQLKGKTRHQQLLLQWTADILNFHFFSTELKLYESPIGKYQEHDVVTRFSRSKDGRMWSEVVHDEPDGAIELTYPPSLQRIVDKIDGDGNEEEKKENVDDNDDANKELLDLIRYITLENRVMQTRVLQLASDLSVSRDDMKRFVKQTSEDKIRIVEHQQYLIRDNMELQKQVQAYKKRIRELELAKNYMNMKK